MVGDAFIGWTPCPLILSKVRFSRMNPKKTPPQRAAFNFGNISPGLFDHEFVAPVLCPSGFVVAGVHRVFFAEADDLHTFGFHAEDDHVLIGSTGTTFAQGEVGLLSQNRTGFIAKFVGIKGEMDSHIGQFLDSFGLGPSLRLGSQSGFIYSGFLLFGRGPQGILRRS